MDRPLVALADSSGDGVPERYGLAARCADWQAGRLRDGLECLVDLSVQRHVAVVRHVRRLVQLSGLQLDRLVPDPIRVDQVFNPFRVHPVVFVPGDHRHEILEDWELREDIHVHKQVAFKRVHAGKLSVFVFRSDQRAQVLLQPRGVLVVVPAGVHD